MDNLTFQNELLNLAEQGYTLIVESRKLAHQLHWRHRLRQRDSGRAGWGQPTIVTLNDWMSRSWERLWPELWPASTLSRWRLLFQVIKDIPPPRPLVPDLSLVFLADEAFEHCLRYGLDPGRGDPAGHLIEWRRTLWGRYGALLADQRLCHPASLPERLCHLGKAASDLVSQRIALVGFEFAGTWEQVLVRLMGEQRKVQHIPLPVGTVAHEAWLCANPEQEVFALLEDLTATAERLPLRELAVIVLNPNVYLPLLSKTLKDLFGPPLVGEHAAYNLFPEGSLGQQPIFQAALLPVDFALKDQSRTLLLSLLKSSYYGCLGRRSRALMQWDWAWREKRLESGLRLFLEALSESAKEILPRRGEELIDGLTPLLVKEPQTGSQWLQGLQNFWRQMEFPVLANASDQIGWQRLQEIIAQFDEVFGPERMNLGELRGWLQAAAAKVYVQEQGLEDAGIQIIGGLDARGLAFQRVYLPGLTLGILPQPAQALPLLSREERKKVQGGAAESQYAFAHHLFKQFQMMAPELVFSRPLRDAKGENALPSPFWPAERERTITPTVPWCDDLPALQRARWISEGITGIYLASKKDPEELFQPEMRFALGSLELPEQISVSKLEVLLACPLRFFFQELIGIEALTEVRRGLDPRKRGQIIHEILKKFGERIVREGVSPDSEWEDLLEALQDTVRAGLAPLRDDPSWAVERKRLIGAEESHAGLLHQWLEREWLRLQKGWRWLAFEATFSRLRFQGTAITISGRLDRLDLHPEEGLCCWDYKTGALPKVMDIWEKLSSPQLPVYLMALEKGLIAGASKEVSDIGVGYIDLRSAAQLKHGPHFQLGDRIAALRAWEKRIAEALKQLERGDLSPCWLNGSCDSRCPYDCLCGVLFPEKRNNF